MSRYTAPSDPDDDVTPYRRRSRTMRIGVWIVLIGVLALVFVDVIAAFV